MKIIKPLSSSISVLMDGNMQNKDVTIRTVDSKTVNLNFFISPGDHKVKIRGLNHPT
ncbi:MAG: hypothetical protein WA631_08655 [Nitrososphaeraceae archaeon]